MKNKILVPLDGSELAAQALPQASELAKRMGAELILLSVIVPMETWLEAAGAFDSDTRLNDEAAAAMAYLTSTGESLDKIGVTARSRVVLGRAAESIRFVANEENADLIAMTTHGRSGLPRLVLGSVAAEVVRTAIQPVLLVRAAAVPAVNVAIKRILVPLDGSEMSEAALPVVAELAAKVNAELILHRVVTPTVVLYPGEVIPGSLAGLEEIEEGAKEYVDGLAGKLRDKGLTVTREVSIGYAPESILQSAADHRVDLIAMSSHGRTGFGRLVLGSVADEVIRRSPQPCLVIRPPAVSKDQVREEPSGVVEFIPGVETPKTVIPVPSLIEHEIEAGAGPSAQAPRPHRPERRGMS